MPRQRGKSADQCVLAYLAIAFDLAKAVDGPNQYIHFHIIVSIFDLMFTILLPGSNIPFFKYW